MFRTEPAATVAPRPHPVETRTKLKLSSEAKAALSVLVLLLATALAWFGFGRAGTDTQQTNSLGVLAAPDAANAMIDVVPPEPIRKDDSELIESNDIEPAPVMVVRPSARLRGSWRRPNDATCTQPLNISIDGSQLTYTREGVTFVERIDLDEGSTVTATSLRINGRPTTPRQFTFRLANDGAQLHLANEIWLHC